MQLQQQNKLLQDQLKQQRALIDSLNRKVTQIQQTEDMRQTKPAYSDLTAKEDEKGKMVIGAIHVAESVGGKPKSGFDPHTLFSISVPLAGDFLQALREALK